MIVIRSRRVFGHRYYFTKVRFDGSNRAVVPISKFYRVGVGFYRRFFRGFFVENPFAVYFYKRYVFRGNVYFFRAFAQGFISRELATCQNRDLLRVYAGTEAEVAEVAPYVQERLTGCSKRNVVKKYVRKEIFTLRIRLCRIYFTFIGVRRGIVIAARQLNTREDIAGTENPCVNNGRFDFVDFFNPSTIFVYPFHIFGNNVGNAVFGYAEALRNFNALMVFSRRTARVCAGNVHLDIAIITAVGTHKYHNGRVTTAACDIALLGTIGSVIVCVNFRKRGAVEVDVVHLLLTCAGKSRVVFVQATALRSFGPIVVRRTNQIRFRTCVLLRLM